MALYCFLVVKVFKKRLSSDALAIERIHEILLEESCTLHEYNQNKFQGMRECQKRKAYVTLISLA